MAGMGRVQQKRIGVILIRDAEIKHLYMVNSLTQKQIAHRLNISQQSVSRILVRDGAVSKTGRKRGVVTSLSTRSLKTFWRFHALHFVVTPYYFFPRYARVRESRGNYAIPHREWKIYLNDGSVEFVLRKGFDFCHADKFESMALAQESLNRSLYEASNAYGFTYEKEGRVSIKLAKQHLSNCNSPLAKAEKGQYLQIKGIDGKVWFTIDKSKGIMEHEYVHSGRLLKDSERVERFLNELREDPDLSLAQVRSNQTLHIRMMGELTNQIKLHLEVMDDMRLSLAEIRKTFNVIAKKV